MPDIWSDLGIEPTDDNGAIRRAYAARLKAQRPDEDPQAFARLRSSYETALRVAGLGAAAPSRSPAVGQDVAPIAPARDGFDECLARQDALAAAEWLIAARAHGELPLQRDIACTDRLGWLLAQDRSLPADAVLSAVRRLGWAPRLPSAAWAGPLRRRVEAEAWLGALRSHAARRWRGGAQVEAARIMLGRGRLWTLPVFSSDQLLRQRFGEYLLHAPEVGDAFDAARIHAIGQVLAPPTTPWVPRWTLVLMAVVGGRMIPGVISESYPAYAAAGNWLGGVTFVVLMAWIYNRKRVAHWASNLRRRR